MRFDRFIVQNYRNVEDSGWIDVGDITALVGQNEAGKSNLFEALYRINPFETKAAYRIDEDWPVDKWGDKDDTALVCQAEFTLTESEIADLFEQATEASEPSESEGDDDGSPSPDALALPTTVTLSAWRSYSGSTQYEFRGEGVDRLDEDELGDWAKDNLPKFVFIRDYDIEGSRVELQELHNKHRQHGWAALTAGEQTMLVVLDLARIDLADFIAKGQSAEGRTVRSFDKAAASAYLSKQFNQLWKQKEVRFDIEVDGNTLNIFVVDHGVDMPIRLANRSTGFRWHVSFAWRFTHASKGQYKDCILLLEEPGIHLHYAGQQDLLEVFDRLAKNNQILYTTHLASLVDPAYPERVRIVQVQAHHTNVVQGIVSNQRAPMAVIEAALGLSGGLGGLLGNRLTLIVEGGIDALILMKLSGLLTRSKKTGLADRVYLWPADGASKTPMYAGFAVGQRWDAAVLLDSDKAGKEAQAKIKALYLKDVAEAEQQKFRVLLLGDAAKIKKTDAGIEDLFPDDFFVNCVNSAYGLSIRPEDLPLDGSDMIAARVEKVLQDRHGYKELDKQRVVAELLKHFDGWKTVDDLPGDSAAHAEALFKAINKAFGV